MIASAVMRADIRQWLGVRVRAAAPIVTLESTRVVLAGQRSRFVCYVALGSIRQQLGARWRATVLNAAPVNFFRILAVGIVWHRTAITVGLGNTRPTVVQLHVFRVLLALCVELP